MKVKHRIRPAILLVLFIFVMLIGLWRVIEDQIEVYQSVGEYYMGDGFFVCRLTLRANGTFSVLFVQDNSVSKEYGGKFTVGNGSIELYANEQATAQGICYAKQLVRVKWENRDYLFLQDDDERSKNLRVNFCQNVVKNIELDRERQGSYYMYINILDKDRINTSEIVEHPPVIQDGSLFCDE